MYRIVLFFLCFTLFAGAGSSLLLAQDTSAAPETSAEATADSEPPEEADAAAPSAGAWPDYPSDLGEHEINRGAGFYFSVFKIFLCWVLFLMWVKTTDWLARDSQTLGEKVEMPSALWIPVMVFPFVLGFFLFATWILPFLAGFPLLVICYAAPFTVYVLSRNARVREEERVFTLDHVKRKWANRGKKTGPQRPAYELGPPVDLFSLAGKDDQENQANLIQARQSPAFITVKELLADAIVKRADKIMLDYTSTAVAGKYQIDGMWHTTPQQEREIGDMMLAVMKKLAGLDVNERKKHQEGLFRAVYRGVKLNCTLTTQGTKTGERVVLLIANPSLYFKSFDELGMREKVRSQLKELLTASSGFFLFSSVPGGGLSTLMRAAGTEVDRYMRDFVSIEDADNRAPEVQNVEPVTFNAAAGETPDSILPALLLKQPEGLIVHSLPNGETVRILCEQVNQENRLVLASVHAKEGVEALLRVLLLKAPAKEFASAITAVLNQRLVRKLCDACKQAYEPAPELLKKLGIPTGRVQAFYREWQPPPPGDESAKKKGEPEICPQCNGIGYCGRTSIFELLILDDKLRQVLVKQPKLELLRQAAKQSGSRTLQEEGVLLVARGVTSLTEIQRVLKQ